ncbi:ABC transporter ATP-binding protein [Fusibacter sp. JL298sf-3]
MKKVFLKQIPRHFYLPVLMLLVIGGEALFSIALMEVVDTVKAVDIDVFVDACKKLIGIAVLLLPLTLLLAYSKGVFVKDSVMALKARYLKGVFEKDIHAFHGTNTGDYVSGITNDIHIIETQYIEGLYTLIYGGLSFVASVAVIAYVSPYILLGGVVFGGLVAVLSIIMGKPLRKQQEARSELLDGYTGFIKEVLSAFHIIKVNALDEKVKSDFYKKSKHIQDRGYAIDKMVTYVSSFQQVISLGILVGVIIFAIFLSIKGQLTFGGVILIVNSMERIMRPLNEVGEWFPKITAASGLFKKLEGKIHDDAVVCESLEMAQFEDKIELEDVAFAYEDKSVLERVGLTIEKGKKYLVVGPSGGGKSTMLRILRKYFSPTSGVVRIDGKPLDQVKKTDYYKLIANIEQQVFLFEDTLRNNLTLYKDISDEELMAALEKAGLKGFVDTHSEGLDYRIFENGKNLSGGERSRIAIARGLLQNAQILYLDEAFSSLDAAVASEIEKTLLELPDMTVVNVSHVIFEQRKAQYDAVVHVNRTVTVGA